MTPSSILSRLGILTETPEMKLSHLSPSWSIPETASLVKIYIRKKDGFTCVKGSYDTNRGWVKANGVAVNILGWESL